MSSSKDTKPPKNVQTVKCLHCGQLFPIEIDMAMDEKEEKE